MSVIAAAVVGFGVTSYLGQSDAADAQKSNGDQAAAVSNRQIDLQEKQYNDQKALQDQYAPIYKQLVEQQAAAATTNNVRSADQWQQYQTVFQPLENQLAADATNYDSPEEIARKRGQAVQDVDQQFAIAKDTAARNLARSGVDAASGRGLALTNANDQAVARAGAATTAEQNVNTQAMALRDNAVKIGRGLTSTGIAADTAAINGSTAASSIAGSQQSAINAAAATGNSILNGAAGSLGTAASIYGAANNTATDANSGIASLLGSNATTTLASKLGGISFLSDPEAKENITTADPKVAQRRVASLEMKNYKYKDGQADGGRHTGPMADDFAEKIGGDGHSIQLVDAIGALLGATQANTKDIQKLAKAKKG
jgi:hypothetical protein